jgi:hypothetical protein
MKLMPLNALLTKYCWSAGLSPKVWAPQIGLLLEIAAGLSLGAALVNVLFP